MNYLVTGGAGFIGSHLVEFLSKSGQVVIIDDLSTGKMVNLEPIRDPENVNLHKADIRRMEAIKPLFKDVDFVFHLAALADVPSSVRDPITSNQINVDGTLNVLAASRDEGVRKVVYSSSSAVYGDAEVPVREDAAVNPKSPYAVSKLVGELYCKVFQELYGLRTVSLRYFNVYGPRQNPESQYGAVIPAFASRLLRGEQPRIYGDGTQTRDFVYVADVVRANIAAAESGASGVINIAGGSPITIKRLFELIKEKTGAKVDSMCGEERPGDIRHSYADIEKAKQSLGWAPLNNLDSGLEKTVEWMT